MACNYIRNSKGQITSATTNTGQESLLYKQLKNISEDKQEVAVRLLAVTETKEFKDWASRGKGIQVNNVGEPALFGEFYRNKEGETWWAKAIDQRDATKKFAFGLNRVPGLTARQVNDIAAFTYAYMLRKTATVEDVAEIDLRSIKNVVQGLKNSAIQRNDLEELNIISILEEDLYDAATGLYSTRSKFLELIKTKLRVDGLIEDELEEKDRKSPLNVKEKYFTSAKDSASVSLKLMVKSIMDTNVTDPTLGRAKPVPFSPTMNLLLRELAGFVPYQTKDGVLDLYDLYIEKLEILSVEFPYMQQLVSKLENAPEHVKTRFVNSIALEKINYTQTLYEGQKRNRIYKLGMPSAQQGFELIRAEWTENFKNKMFDYNNNANVILNEEYAKKIPAQYLALRKNARENSNKLLSEVQKDFKQLLGSVGIELSDPAINTFYNTKEKIFEALSSTEDNLGYIFASEIPKIVKRFQVRAKGRQNTITIPDADLPIKNEKSVRKLALQEERFRPEYLDNSSLGPNGDTYWGFGNYSWLAQALDTMKQEDSNFLSGLSELPYNINSKWIKQLEAGKEINRSVFMQMKENKRYDGYKYFNLAEPDQLADRLARVWNGEHLLMTPGNSRTLYTLSGFDYESSGVNVTYDSKTQTYNFEYTNDQVLDTFRGYIIDEFAAMKQAYAQVFKGALSKEQQKLYYHYDKDGNERDSQGKPAGNAFKHTLFPELSFGEAYSEGFYTNQGEPIYNYKMLAQNPRITELIKQQYEKYVVSQIEKAVEYKLITSNLTSLQLPTNILRDKKWFKNLGNLVVGRAFSDYVFSSIVANVESTKLFVGQIQFFKNTEDYVKRANLYSTAVTPMRFIDGKVNKNYLQATVNDIFSPSKYLQNIEGYDNVDLADATTWITPELQKQRMIGFGEFTPEAEAAYSRLLAGQLQISDILKLTPRKSAARGAKIENGMYVPYREKTAEVVLWPGLVKDNGLQKLLDKMQEIEKEYEEDNGVKLGMSVSVESAIKVGAGLRTKIDNDQGEILDEIELSPNLQSHLLYGKQQEIPTKGIKPSTFGSQLKVNILADVKEDVLIGGIPGTEWRKAVEQVEIDISNLGREQFLNTFNIDPDTYQAKIDENGNNLFYKSLIEELSKETFPDEALIEALEQGLNFDAVFQSRRKIQNLLANKLTNSTVTYDTNGATMVQITSFGLFQSPTSIKSLDQATQSRIKYLKDGKLKPPRIENGKLFLGDVFMPYSYVEKIPGHEKMSDRELKEAIGKDVLTIAGYRIPNQSLASTDMLEIAGILPKEAGDTVVVYEEMTAKTGSDFDIDKLFMLIPNVEYNKATGKLEIIDPQGTSKKSLENRRLQLYKQLFETVEEYPRIIKSIDNKSLKENAYELIEIAQEQDDFDGLKLFTGEFQQDLKTRFSAGAAGVGATANNTIDNVFAQGAKMYTNDLGFGSKTAEIEGVTKTILYSTDRIDGSLISEIMSGYMNAFVDIEKDPYITAINFVKPVMNVAYLMLRAGMNPKFINAFIKQPIIVEYAKQAARGRSPLLNPTSFVSESAVLGSMKAQATTPQELNIINLENLETALNPDSDTIEGLDTEVLNYFAYLYPIGQELFEKNLASKLHTEGVGQDLLDAKLKIEKIDDLIYDEESSIENFGAKFNEDTMLGTYLKNGPELFTDLFTDKFLSGRFDSIDGEIGQTLGRFYRYNYRTRRAVEDSLYSYMYSTHDFSSSMQDLLFDTKTKKSLVPRLIDMQKRFPNSILLNTLLRYKYARNVEGQFTTPSQIYMAATKHLPADTKQIAKQEWEDGLNSEDKTVRDFYNDLASYAYHTSGFRNGVQTFHTLIPTMWNGDNEFNATVEYLGLEDDFTFAQGIEQVIQHEHTNTSLAPRVSKVKAIGNIPFSEGFITKRDNMYLSRKLEDGKVGLYKYAGSMSANNHVFVRLNTLGFKGEDGFRVVEYKFGESDVNSIFADNNVNLSPTMEAYARKEGLLIGRKAEDMKIEKASEQDKCK